MSAENECAESSFYTDPHSIDYSETRKAAYASDRPQAMNVASTKQGHIVALSRNLQPVHKYQARSVN